MQERNAAIKIPDSRTDKAFFYSQWPPNVKCGSCPRSRRREFSFPGARICLGCSVTFPFPPHLIQGFWVIFGKVFGAWSGLGRGPPKLSLDRSTAETFTKRRGDGIELRSRPQLTSLSEVSSGWPKSLLISVWNNSDLFCTKRCDRMGLPRPRR